MKWNDSLPTSRCCPSISFLGCNLGAISWEWKILFSSFCEGIARSTKMGKSSCGVKNTNIYSEKARKKISYKSWGSRQVEGWVLNLKDIVYMVERAQVKICWSRKSRKYKLLFPHLYLVVDVWFSYMNETFLPKLVSWMSE